jgi:hypothetical protein
MWDHEYQKGFMSVGMEISDGDAKIMWYLLVFYIVTL